MKLFHYLRQCLAREKWVRFRKQSHRAQLLERSATIIAQCFQPQKDVFYSFAKTSLDNIALEVLNCLREKHPDHSIFSTTAENFAYWKNNNIDDNHWNEMEGTQIMDALMILLEMLEILMNLEWCNNTLMVMPQEMAFAYVWSTNLKELSFHVNEIEQSNIRPKEVKFAVGMVVTHNKKKFNQSANSSAGVIVGWHRYEDRHNVKFSVNKLTDSVLPLKICSNFSSTKRQAHYIILTENKEMCYIEEDAITKTTPKWIDNNEIGRYFCKSEDTHYVPNEMLGEILPA